MGQRSGQARVGGARRGVPSPSPRRGRSTSPSHFSAQDEGSRGKLVYAHVHSLPEGQLLQRGQLRLLASRLIERGAVGRGVHVAFGDATSGTRGESFIYKHTPHLSHELWMLVGTSRNPNKPTSGLNLFDLTHVAIFERKHTKEVKGDVAMQHNLILQRNAM